MSLSDTLDDRKRPFKDDKARPLEPTDEKLEEWNGMGRERNRDPDYMRYLQSRRSHKSLSESGRAGFRETSRKYGYDAAMEFAAGYWREHPEKASEPEKGMSRLLDDLGQREGDDYRHIYKTAEHTWADYAWPDRMKAVEVWGGVHTAEFHNRVQPDESKAAQLRDEHRIQRMQANGWDVKIVMDHELKPSRIERTREHVEQFLNQENERYEQGFIPGVFPGERGEEAERYALEMRVADTLRDVDQQPGEDYARSFRIDKDLHSVPFAWLDTKRAAVIYRDEQEEQADESFRQQVAEKGWRIMPLRADRDLIDSERSWISGVLDEFGRGER